MEQDPKEAVPGFLMTRVIVLGVDHDGTVHILDGQHRAATTEMSPKLTEGATDEYDRD